MLGILGQSPDLGSVISDAEGTGRIGGCAGSLSTAIHRRLLLFRGQEESHLNVNYCCFPTSDQTGVMHYSPNSPMGPARFTAICRPTPPMTRSSRPRCLSWRISSIRIRDRDSADHPGGVQNLRYGPERRPAHRLRPMVAGARLWFRQGHCANHRCSQWRRGLSKFTTRTTLLNSDYKSYRLRNRAVFPFAVLIVNGPYHLSYQNKDEKSGQHSSGLQHFDSGVYRILAVRWLFPQEKATFDALVMSTSEAKKL